MTERHGGWARKIGDRSQNHTGVCRLWKIQHKAPRTDGRIPKTKAGGKESLEKYMNGPQPTLTDRPHTWNKSCKDSAKREGDTLKLAANDEEKEDEKKGQHQQVLQTTSQEKEKDKRKKYRKIDEAQARASATEQKNLQVQRVHADVDRGPWATTLHHGQNMEDDAE